MDLKKLAPLEASLAALGSGLRAVKAVLASGAKLARAVLSVAAHASQEGLVQPEAGDLASESARADALLDRLEGWRAAAAALLRELRQALAGPGSALDEATAPLLAPPLGLTGEAAVAREAAARVALLPKLAASLREAAEAAVHKITEARAAAAAAAGTPVGPTGVPLSLSAILPRAASDGLRKAAGAARALVVKLMQGGAEALEGALSSAGPVGQAALEIALQTDAAAVSLFGDAATDASGCASEALKLAAPAAQAAGALAVRVASSKSLIGSAMAADWAKGSKELELGAPLRQAAGALAGAAAAAGQAASAVGQALVSDTMGTALQTVAEITLGALQLAEAVPFAGMAAKFIGALVARMNAVRANDALFATLKVRLARLQRALGGSPGSAKGEDLKMTATASLAGGASRVDDANWQSQAKSILAAARALIDRAEAASKTWIGFGARVLFSSPLKAQFEALEKELDSIVEALGYQLLDTVDLLSEEVKRARENEERLAALIVEYGGGGDLPTALEHLQVCGGPIPEC